MAVHASVYEGLLGTNTKRFLHNNIKALEQVLSIAQDKYRTKMVIVDGVYSQDGDITKLKEILEITHRYGRILLVDDAHGIGVIGETGRGPWNSSTCWRTWILLQVPSARHLAT